MDGFVKYVGPSVDFGEAPAVDMFSRTWEKRAGMAIYMPPAIEEFMKTAEPIPGKRLLLVHGLGSEEAWGFNRNGDGFPEMWKGAKNLIEDDDAKDYGYHTFAKHAHTFRDHRNHDPRLTIGGKVVVAAWNPEMRRAELIIPVSEKEAPDVVDAIDRDEKIAVSMGCFIAGTLITMADGSRKPIEEIQVGDYVLTHKGRSRKVTELHKRAYDGVFFMIRPEAHEPFVCTQEHPLLVVDRDDVKKGKSGGPRWVTKEEADRIGPKWIHAECFNPDQHYLLEPVLQDVVTPEYATREFARLLGYYVAEGHVLRNKSKDICGVEFTVNTSDIFLTEIGELAEKYGTKNPPVIRQRDNCDDAVSVQIFDAELAERLYAHGGSYAKQKKLSESFMQWHPDIQREFVGAWAEGDGHGLDSGALSISTGSDALAWQLMTVLARMDICASINCLTHKAGSGFSKKTTYEWVIHVGKQWAQGLHDVCLKIKDSPVLLAKNNRLHTGKFIITPVREMEASRNAVDVYNFEVAEDESYVAAGVAVHNCKVPYDVCSDCGNKAKHRGEYCKHAKHEMNRIRPNGVKVGVHNPRPKFFDISVLGNRGQGRPADPSAFSLAKVAHVTSEQAAEEWPDRPKIFKLGYIRQGARKNADIKKEVPAEAEEATKERLEKIKILAPYNAKEAKALPRTAITGLRTQQPEKVAATLTALGITLRPDEFAEVFPQGAPAIDFNKISMGLVENYEKHMPARSDWLSYFGDRMYRHVKVGSDAAPLGQGSEAYKNYLENVKNAVSKPSMIKELVAAVDRHPYLKSAIARHELSKLAAGAKGLSAGNLIAAMLGPMVLSSYFRSQQMMDPWSVGPVKSLVAEHPLATGAATALLWHKLKGGKVPLISS